MHQPEQAAEVIIGVDTHKDTHTAVALNTLGTRLGTTTILVSREGYRQIEAWARSFGSVWAFGIECTGSYGAGLSRASSPTTAPNRCWRTRARPIAPHAGPKPACLSLGKGSPRPNGRLNSASSNSTAERPRLPLLGSSPPCRRRLRPTSRRLM